MSALHTDQPFSRRRFLSHSAAAVGLAGCAPRIEPDDPPAPSFQTRGVVLLPFDLTLRDWPRRAAEARLTHIGLHAVRRLDVMVDFIASDQGRQFLADCRRHHIHVEYELHAMADLLSRELFYKDRSMFRQAENGRRTPDANCCPHSTDALDLIAENASRYARVLRPTTHRYFYWPDDGSAWCHCPRCKSLSASDQALIVENHILRRLRRDDPHAQLAHLAYQLTTDPPQSIVPERGIFLEFAPGARTYDYSIAHHHALNAIDRGPAPKTHGQYLDLLDANLEVFPVHTAQVLEYWLDASRFAGWARPVTRLPWNREIFQADVAEYRRHQIRHMSSFAVGLNAEYLQLHGEIDVLNGACHDAPPQPLVSVYPCRTSRRRDDHGDSAGAADACDGEGGV